MINSDKINQLSDKIKKVQNNNSIPQNAKDKLILKLSEEILELESQSEEVKSEPVLPNEVVVIKKEKKIKKPDLILDDASLPAKKKRGKSIDLSYDVDELIKLEKEKHEKRKIK